MVFAVELESPNVLSRKENLIEALILRTYIGDSKKIIDSFLHPSSETSTHFLIDEKGNIFHFVPETKAAMVTNSSFWRGIEDINLRSISIALTAKEEGVFSENQIQSLINITKEKASAHKIKPQNIVSACDVSFIMHSDIGIPWKELASHGVGLWTESDKEEFEEGTLLNILTDIGYRINVQSYKMAILAFQKHFLPLHVSGEEDTRTLKRAASIKALFDSVSG